MPARRPTPSVSSALGAPRVVTAGNLKLDVPAPPADGKKLTELKDAIAMRPMIAAVSTHPGEDGAVIEAHQRLRGNFPGLLTLIAPRHPERGPGVFELAAAAGLKAALRSRGERLDAATDIYVADTMGELGLIYRLAPVVFIGGSLVKHGGQNPIEAAKLGAAILHGPHVWNFTEIYDALDAAHGAEPVADAERLTAAFGAWLADAGRARPRDRCRAHDGRRARRRARTHAGIARALSHATAIARAGQPCVTRPSGGARRACAAALLAPLAAGYGAIAARRMGKAGARAGLPVLCVGNFTLGGAGKTPTAIAIAKMLTEAGERVFCLSRGYGGSHAGPKLVDAHADTADQVGDEALLLARAAPTIIARDRVDGRRAGASEGRQRRRHGRRLAERLDRQGFHARRRRRTARHRQWMRVSRRPLARAARGAACAHRRVAGGRRG